MTRLQSPERLFVLDSIKSLESEIKVIWLSIKDFVDGNSVGKVEKGFNEIKIKKQEIDKLKKCLL